MYVRRSTVVEVGLDDVYEKRGKSLLAFHPRLVERKGSGVRLFLCILSCLGFKLLRCELFGLQD